MRHFNSLFPEVAKKETLVVQTEDDALPNGNYAFLECFCDNLGCPCASVTLDVIALDNSDPKNSKKITAINFSWEEPLSKNNPSLHEEADQSHLAQAALTVFSHLVENNGYIADKFKNHYAMVRRHIQNKVTRPDFKNGRNDPCSCGSGKKFKKCCL
jgi:hypothetical protein